MPVTTHGVTMERVTEIQWQRVHWGRVGRPAWTFVSKHPVGAAGACVVLVWILMAVFADSVAPHDPFAVDISRQFKGPGSEFYLGSDNLGRDQFSRIIYGSRISLYVGLGSVSVGTVIGTILGVVSAYASGKFDLIIQRVVDALMGFPSLVLALVLVAALGASLNNVVVAIAAVLTPRMIRLSRASALSIKQEAYVLAAQAIGASSSRIVFRHILPNSLAPVFVVATGYLGTAVIVEASLSFLGLGVPPPHPAWGSMLQQGAREWIWDAPWLAIFPGVALSSIVFGFTLFGDALRDALDPRLRER